MADNIIDIFIDSCAVDIFYKKCVDLVHEFPTSKYKLVLTKAVCNELQDIPDEKPIKNYALSLIENPAGSKAGSKTPIVTILIENPAGSKAGSKTPIVTIDIPVYQQYK